MRGHTSTDLSDSVLDTFRGFDWLEVDPRPSDWNGPTTRPLTRFHDQNLDRPIIEHFERVARRHRHRIAIREANTALTFGELWDAVSGLAETLAADTEPGDLIAILLPVWRRHARTIVVVETPGTDFTMLSPRHAESTAACVTRCLPAGPLPLGQWQTRVNEL